VLSSCTTQLAKLERSNDYGELFNGAVAFYEKGQYGKAKVLFERIQPFYRGSEYSENFLKEFNPSIEGLNTQKKLDTIGHIANTIVDFIN